MSRCCRRVAGEGRAGRKALAVFDCVLLWDENVSNLYLVLIVVNVKTEHVFVFTVHDSQQFFQPNG